MGRPKKVVEEEDLAVVGTANDSYKVSGDEPDEEDGAVTEDITVFDVAEEDVTVSEPHDITTEPIGNETGLIVPEYDPDGEDTYESYGYDAVVVPIRTAIQTYQEWLRKGVSPDTAFFESKLHDAIKDVKAEDWF